MRKYIFLIFFLSIILIPFLISAQRVLICDYMLSDPVLYINILQKLPEYSIEVDYRRFYPSIVENDRFYNMIILAASRHPYPSPDKMTLAEADFLHSFIREGGILVPLYSSEDNDRIILNRLLEKLSINIRIEGKYIADPVNGYRSTLIPSSYFLNLPMLQISQKSPLGIGVKTICGGRCPGLLVGLGDNFSIPVYSFDTSMRLERLDTEAGIKTWEGIYLGGQYSAGVMAVGKAGDGYIVLLPRYLFNLSGYTARFSDKPALPVPDIKKNRIFEENLIQLLISIIKKTYKFKPFNPVLRADNLNNFKDKSEKVTLEQGKINTSIPEDTYDNILINPDKKRELKIKNKVFRELIESKIRSTYTTISGMYKNPDRLDRMCRINKEIGLNLVFGMLLNSPYHGLKNERTKNEYVEGLRAIYKSFEKNNLKVMSGAWFPIPDYFRNKPYSKLVISSGKEDGPPSPLDRQFWADSFLPQAVEFAKLSTEFPNTLIGMLSDLELYGFDTIILSEAFTFDNLTFNYFLEKNEELLKQKEIYKRAAQTDKSQRYNLLKELGFLKIYYNTLEKGVEEIARWIDSEITKINPDFVWGFYVAGIPHSWYYRGLFRGLSSPERPIVLITYDVLGKEQMDYYAQHDIFAVYCPGTLLNTFKGKEWSKCLTYFAGENDGYWLFPGGSLLAGDDWKYKRVDYNILEPPDELLKSIKRANEAIKK